MALPIRSNRAPVQWGGTWPSGSWNPFMEFQQLWDQMGRMFEQSADIDNTGWRPIAETEETSDAYLVRAELPGLKREDVHVEIDGNELCVSGEIDKEEETEGNMLRRRTGKFVYRTILPSDADTEKIGGELSDGVLTVRVPKNELGRSRRVQIKG